MKGRLSPGDRFVQDETIEEVIPEAARSHLRPVSAASTLASRYKFLFYHSPFLDLYDTIAICSI